MRDRQHGVHTVRNAEVISSGAGVRRSKYGFLDQNKPQELGVLYRIRVRSAASAITQGRQALRNNRKSPHLWRSSVRCTCGICFGKRSNEVSREPTFAFGA